MKATPRTRNNRSLIPAGPGSVEPIEIAPEDDPRQQLLTGWLDLDNRLLRPLVNNRYWKHFFDRGIVEPEDDMRNEPPTNPELPDASS
ncbi:MAG: DUF1553 domain-containing protein [Planctomycetaceae bacterium]